MHSTETHHRFIELRAHGWSLARIADDLQVAKSTLVIWQRQFHREIADHKSVELEALQEKLLDSHEDELSRLAGHLKRVESVLAKRNFEVLSTEFLFCMAGALRSQIRKQRVVPVFSPSSSDGQPETGCGETPSRHVTTPAPKPETPDPQPSTL